MYGGWFDRLTMSGYKMSGYTIQGKRIITRATPATVIPVTEPSLS